MQSAREKARTLEGRKELLKDPTTFTTIESCLTTKSELDHAVACLANLFTDDTEGIVLNKAKTSLELLIGLLTQKSSPTTTTTWTIACILFSNCAKQSASHVKFLRECNTVPLLVSHIRDIPQASPALKAILEEESDDAYQEDVYVIKELCEVSLLETIQDRIRETVFTTLLIVRILCQEYDRISPAIVTYAAKFPTVTENVFDSALDLFKLDERKGRQFIPLLFPLIKRSLEQYMAHSSLEASIHIAILASELVALVTTTGSSSSSSQDSQLFANLFELQLVATLLDTIAKCSTNINPQVERDQSKLLPHARIRLFSLNCLTNVSANEQRSRRLVEEYNYHILSFNIIINMVSFDYEATRACMNCFRNLVLASGRKVCMETNILLLVKTVVPSKDHNVSFLAANVYHLVAIKQAKYSSEVYKKLVADSKCLLAILEMDVSPIHPHARVELCRAVCIMMQCQQEYSVSVPPLETEQAVKFISFLVISELPELQMEALQAMLCLPEGLLKILDFEIASGTTLVARLQELKRNTENVIDSIALVNLHRVCTELLEKMDQTE